MNEAKAKGILLGAGVLCVVSFLFFLGGLMRPLAQDPRAHSVPRLEELGVLLSETPPGPVAPEASKEPSRRISAGRRGSSGRSQLEPPAAVREEIKKGGSLVY